MLKMTEDNQFDDESTSQKNHEYQVFLWNIHTPHEIMNRFLPSFKDLDTICQEPT